MYYVIIDEIQKVDDLESVLNGFLHVRNLDVYVTGSNYKFLLTDIITEFRDRGDEIKVLPLSFKEYSYVYLGTPEDAWEEYTIYGDLPRILSYKTEEEKSKYLIDLFKETFLKDIVERYNIQRIDILDTLVNMISFSIGSLTNPKKISDSFISNGIKDVSVNTIISYLGYLEEAFLINKAERYDVKGKKYISTPYKYYFSDIGLRNARINFRQQKETHIMLSIIEII